MIRIGIDVGGTFTDFTLFDAGNGTLNFFKVPSNPADPSEAIENGLRQMRDVFGYRPAEVTYLAHGTTVATNTVIQRNGARTGLLTTKGFRDVLELGRQARPSIYDYRVQKPPVLVPRDRRFEVTERVDAEGEVWTPLDRDSLKRAVEGLAGTGVEAVAVCFMHSYLHPEHEAEARAAVEAALPGVYVTSSAEILPEFREFERMSTTVINATLGPKLDGYLDRFQARVKAVGIPVTPYTIHSNGGLMPVDEVRRAPVRTCVSGPAAGVVGAAEVGRIAGLPDLVTFDVGGTSTDVSLIENGSPMFTSARLVAGYPVKTPMVDIHVIGAGGGSIAALDDAGALKVGPESAGADPGPVAYGRGGTAPTLTDANLVLGRLAPKDMLGGRMTVDRDAARTAIERAIAEPLGLTAEEAAHGIIQIAVANMGRAIRSVSVEKGHDLNRLALAAFGGAGPLHAAEVARECGLSRILVPREPGTLCAQGMLLSDLSLDLVRSRMADAGPAAWAEILTLFAEMEAEGAAFLDREGVPEERRAYRRMLDARYLGQNFEVPVSCDGLGPDGLREFEERFHAAHRREYGYDIRHRAIEFVSPRLKAIGRIARQSAQLFSGGRSLQEAQTGVRQIYADRDGGWQEATVFDRLRLPEGTPIKGPAVVTEMSATTLILPNQTGEADAWGNLILMEAS
ncbi:MAG: hydantoinase/oxoprolinase family protein [Pseudomonadota bacterium]